MNGELKEYVNRQLVETTRSLPFDSEDRERLSKRAWELAVRYMQSLPDEVCRGPNQVALASLVLAADSLEWSLQKRYELSRSIDNSMFAFSIFGEMGRTLGL